MSEETLKDYLRYAVEMLRYLNESDDEDAIILNKK